MGSGDYSITNRYNSGRTTLYSRGSREEIFGQKNMNNAMNPYGVKSRESRDSEEHPNSLAIILALDVTGSMGSIPHYLVKKGLPSIMDQIIQEGVKDPQVLFLGVGDHTCDDAPLQVGQFESSDRLLDKWLTSIWLESGGGGNMGESYLLAWYFAAYHTQIDCFEKRKQKGILFTIGDEPVLPDISSIHLKKIMGPGQYNNFNALELLDKAREKYIVKHLHMEEGYNGQDQRIIDDWKQIMKQEIILVKNREDIPEIISNTILNNTETTKIIEKKTEILL